MTTDHQPPFPGVTAERLGAVLQAALAPTTLDVQDDSHLHAGHAGAREGRHFTVRVVSPAFTGLSRVARHRLVYDAARSLIAEGIHALAIEARTPAEAG
jgi:BolA family transcriptional regulator, general stress-responsive regulator